MNKTAVNKASVAKSSLAKRSLMKKSWINKSLWMKVHVYLSLFFLPAAFIYALTGSLFLFNIREQAWADIKKIDVGHVEKGKERELMLNELANRNIEIPRNTELKNFRGALTMGNIAYSVSLIKDNKTGKHQIQVTDRSLYGILLLMHKGKGKFFFDIIAVCFSISLMIFYFSGLVMTSFCKRKRKLALLTFFGGMIVTGIMVYLSVVM